MKHGSLTWRRTGEIRQSRRMLVFFFAIVGGLMAWGLIWGKTERARYIGVQTGAQTKDGVLLRTEPQSNFLMPGKSNVSALKEGCVYDFHFDTDFGFDQHPGRTKRVRKAVLVAC